MRRGATTWEVVTEIILVLVILLTILVIWYEKSNSFDNGLKDFQACEGLVGTLGGKDGYCSAAKNCGDVKAKNTDPNYYFQYIGQGWGCPDTKYCCILIPNSQNPLTKDAIHSAQCDALQTPGKIIINANGQCTDSGAATAPADGPLSATYFLTQNDKQCSMSVSFQGMSLENDNFACPQKSFSIMSNSLVDYLNIRRLDLSVANNGGTLTITANGITRSIAITPPQKKICSLLSVEQCREQESGSVISQNPFTTCVMQNDGSCSAKKQNDRIVCSYVDTSLVTNVDDRSLCQDKVANCYTSSGIISKTYYACLKSDATTNNRCTQKETTQDYINAAQYPPC